MAWLGTWAKRIEVTISNSNVDSDLTDFPVLLYLSASSGSGGDDVSAIFDELTSDANRKKIAVTSSDGTTELYVEIERWDDASEKAWLWVKVPSVAAASVTTLYIYYDSAQSDNTAYVGDTESTPAENVWDSDFVLVWHMAEDPSGGTGCIKDSTSNNKDGTPAGTMTSGDLVDGQIGKGIEFDGLDDNIAVSITRLTSEGTIEIICKETGTVANYDCPIGCSSSGQTGDICIEASSNTTIRMWIYDIGGVTDINVDFSDWCHLAWTLTGGNAAKLWEFVSGNSTTYSNASNAIGASLEIGDADVFNSNWPGIIDEVRISQIKRSDAWLKASYHSNIDDLISAFGTEEANSTVVTLTEALVMTLGLSGEVGFTVSLTNPLEITLGFGIPMVRYVGRDMISLRSFITKDYLKDSPVEKVMEKQSRLTKFYEHISSLR